MECRGRTTRGDARTLEFYAVSLGDAREQSILGQVPGRARWVLRARCADSARAGSDGYNDLDLTGETLRYGGDPEPWSLERLMKLYHENMPAIESEGWLTFIRRCLDYQPELRPTAVELLQDSRLCEE